jgi:hypothetical protein
MIATSSARRASPAFQGNQRRLERPAGDGRLRQVAPVRATFGVPDANASADGYFRGDLGFRVDGRKGNAPVGSLVVRVNGQWVEAEFGAGVKRLTAR